MLSVDEARRILLEAVRPLPRREVELGEAAGHVLAESVPADRDYPPTDRSAMDGYAVRACDVATAGVELAITGEQPAGRSAGSVRVGAGQAVRVMTGSVVPEGADAVVLQERTESVVGTGAVRVLEGVKPGQHIRRRGEEARQGQVVLTAGTLVRPAEIAALAAIGRARVPVHRLPSVAILSTGDEIVEADRAPAEHQVRNSNARTLQAQLAELGLSSSYLGIAADRRTDLDAKLADGLRADVLLITGGVSEGAYDLVGEALHAAGVRTLFHGVAMKPGKPVLAGLRGERLVVGLPGNPLSTFTAFLVLVAPALRRMGGLATVLEPELPALLAAPVRGGGGRRTYHLARLEADAAELVARPVASRGSGDLLALSRANAFIVTAEDEGGEIAAGARVSVLAWRGWNLAAAN